MTLVLVEVDNIRPMGKVFAIPEKVLLLSS